MSEAVHTTDPVKGKDVFVGTIETGANGAKYLEKSVKESAHLFRVHDGYAIQLDVLEKIKEKISFIIINETDTGIVYAAPINTWMDKGYKPSKTHGEQWVLQRKHMYRLVKKDE